MIMRTSSPSSHNHVQQKQQNKASNNPKKKQIKENQNQFISVKSHILLAP